MIAAGDADEGLKARALSELCEMYWKPIYLYVRGRGRNAADAEDLTQGFFGSILERQKLESLERVEGRLRSYLLKSVKNFMISDWKRDHALKRGGGVEHLPLEMDEGERLFASQESGAQPPRPDHLFERQWALTLIEQALGRLQEEYESIGRKDTFDALSPLLEDMGKWKASGLAERLGMTESSVRVAIHRMRKRFRGLLEEEIRQTVVDPAEVEDEMRHLLTVLAAA